MTRAGNNTCGCRWPTSVSEFQPLFGLQRIELTSAGAPGAALRLAAIATESYAGDMNERLTIELPDAIVARLREIAAQSGLTVEEFIAGCATAHATPDGVRPDVAALLDAVLDGHSELYHRLA